MTLETTWVKNLLESRRTVWLVGGIAICFFALTNVPWNLDDYDQALQAYTSFEMIKGGHWLFQHTPHGLIAQKPPLVGWASAATFLITRSWNVAWRLPCFLSAVAVATILFRAVRAAYGAAPALVALGAFSLNLLSVRLATLVRTDMPLALFLFLPGLLIWQKIRTRQSWQRRDRWAMFAFFTASMLIKGPMNFAFILPGIVLYQLLVAKRSGTSAKLLTRRFGSVGSIRRNKLHPNPSKPANFHEEKVQKGIDYGFRPTSYWEFTDPLKAILLNVKGTNRRRMIRDYWKAGMQFDDFRSHFELAIYSPFP